MTERVVSSRITVYRPLSGGRDQHQNNAVARNIWVSLMIWLAPTAVGFTHYMASSINMGFIPFLARMGVWVSLLEWLAYKHWFSHNYRLARRWWFSRPRWLAQELRVIAFFGSRVNCGWHECPGYFRA